MADENEQEVPEQEITEQEVTEQDATQQQEGGVEAKEIDDETKYAEENTETKEPEVDNDDTKFIEADEEDVIEDEQSTDEIEAIREQKRLTAEYMEILTNISTQNQILKGLKERLFEIKETDLNDTCIRHEILGIRCCLEQEKRKLKCLIEKVIIFQHEHPLGPWEHVSIETSVSEDCILSGKKEVLCSAACKNVRASKKKID